MTKNTDPFEHSDEEEIEYVSKSELKRDAQRMRDLAQQLTELKPSLWPELPIGDNLLEAIEENVRLNSHEAKRRHLQYMGKLIRKEDLDAIYEFLDLQDSSSEAYGRIQKQQEMWRERLIKDSSALSDFIEHYPEVDRQQLRNLVRNAQKDLSKNPGKASTNYRKLFQFIKQVTA